MPLRMLLAAASGGMLAGCAAFLLYELISGTPRGAAGLFVVVLVLAGALAILGLRDDLNVPQLRWVERGVFGAMTLYLGWRAYAALAAHATSGDPTSLSARWHLTLVHFVLLMVAYGALVPNDLGRAARGVGLLATVPIVVGVALRARLAESSDVLAAVLTQAKLLEGVAVLTVSAALATVAAYVIDKYLELARTTRVTLRYELKRRIGMGGMGEVWLGEHNLLARPAAVKLIRPDAIDARNPERADIVLRRFEREAKATAALRSSHTVEVYDFGLADDRVFYYAMEYLDGIDLATLVKQHGPVPAERAVHLLAQACRSLADAHAQGMTHRDVKPANIFTCRMGTALDFVKVLDFGLVTGGKLPGLHGEGLTDLTLDGEINGTPGYMAPEMVRPGQSIDGRADLYALGCVAYFLLTGSAVFEGPPLGVLVDHVKTEPPPPSTRTDLTIPSELETIVMRCLAKDPADRFATAADLADALQACCPEPRWTQRRAAEWWDLHLPAAAIASVSRTTVTGH